MSPCTVLAPFQLLQDSTFLTFKPRPSFPSQNRVLNTLSSAPEAVAIGRACSLPLFSVGLGHSGEPPCYSGTGVSGIHAEATTTRRENSKVATGHLVDLKTWTQ